MHSTTDNLSSALQGCLETCRRCERLVRLCIDESGDPNVFEAIGPHLRNCLDHYRALLSGLNTGTIDYDDRVRDLGEETDPEFFLAALFEVTAELAGLERISTMQSVQVIQSAAPNVTPIPAGSTLERELLYLSSHTICHLALAVEIASGRGVSMPSGLGIAFSTAAYLEGKESAAS